MSISMADVAMSKVEAVGFSPQRACDACEANNGLMVYSHEPMIPGKLWRTYAFPDDSVMNVHAKGCAVFQPGERVTKTFPSLDFNNHLY